LVPSRASISLVVVLRREWFDRPRLYVQVQHTAHPDGTHQEFLVNVENRGRQPATLGSFGVCWDLTPDVGAEPKGEIIINDPWERTRIEPGDPVRRTFRPDGGHIHFPFDAPARFFVEFNGSRRVYQAKPVVIYRSMELFGWVPPKDIAPSLAEDNTHVLTRPVVARWKFWRDRQLRTACRPDPFPFTHEQIVKAQQLAIVMAAKNQDR